MMKPTKDTLWLFENILFFLEHKLEDKKRFANMSGGDFTHSLMMIYGAYLINQKETGCLTILPIKKPKEDASRK